MWHLHHRYHNNLKPDYSIAPTTVYRVYACERYSVKMIFGSLRSPSMNYSPTPMIYDFYFKLHEKRWSEKELDLNVCLDVAGEKNVMIDIILPFFVISASITAWLNTRRCGTRIDIHFLQHWICIGSWKPRISLNPTSLSRWWCYKHNESTSTRSKRI